MQVTRLRAWLALLGVGMILLAFAVWGFTGRIQVTTEGRGILLKGETGITTVKTTLRGQISDLYVDVEDIISAGEIIARIQDESGSLIPVTTLHGGRVLETLVSSNELVEPGQRLIILEPSGDDTELRAIFYLPISEGKKVRPGMSVQVRPDTVNAQEFGVMVGWVTRVGEFAENRESINRVLENEELTQSFFEVTNNAPLEVHVQFIPSRTTFTGYRWTTPEGPALEVRSGTLANATIVLSDEIPLTLIFSPRR